MQHVAGWWIAGFHPPMIPRDMAAWNALTPAEKEGAAEDYHEYFGSNVWGGAPAWGSQEGYEGTLDWWGRLIGDDGCDPRVVDDPDCIPDPPPEDPGSAGGVGLLLVVGVIAVAYVAGRA